MERAADLQAVQIGPEAVAGTAVAADTILSSLDSLSFAPQVTANADRRPAGTKFPTFVVPGREWVEADVGGAMSYQEMPYWLSAALKAVAPGAAGVDGEVDWDFVISRAVQDVPKTFTIEQGGPDRAQKVAHAFLSSLSFHVDPDNATWTGRLMGKSIADGIVMTADPTSPEEAPVHSRHVSVYLDPDAASIGTTKLTRDFVMDLSIADHFQTVFAIDAEAQGGFAAVVERVPVITLQLTLASDAVGMGLLSTLRSGGKKFFRMEAEGPAIGASQYRLALDGCFAPTGMGAYGEDQGVVTNQWTFRALYDPDLAKAFSAHVTNELAAL